MVFSSVVFLLYFLPITVLFYFITPNRFKNIVLLFFSLIFYSWGETKYFVLILVSMVLDFTLAKIIYNQNSITKKRLALAISIFVNLGFLFLFKYSNFFIELANSLFGVGLDTINIGLPLGISFYTFQTLTYSIDVYMGKVLPERKLINFATYVCMFPQLIAGPIVRYSDIQAHLSSRNVDIYSIQKGVKIFILGLASKVLLANSLGLYWDSIIIKDIASISTVSAWVSIICFSLQIYFDFYGYSLMAIGLGKIFGFEFPVNFKNPYASKSISEFWTRWHITLGSFFKEYVYIPLGGNRGSICKLIFNMFVVWFLTGLWHGAEFNFLIWGMYFLVIILIEKFFIGKFLIGSKICAHIYTLFVLIIGWLIFATSDLAYIKSFLIRMFSYNSSPNTFYDISNILVVLVIAILLCIPGFTLFAKKRLERFGFLECIFYISLLLLSIIYIVSSTYNPFLYFRF